MRTRALDASVEPAVGMEDGETEFVPVLRSGAWTDIGSRTCMEDVYLCSDNFMHDFGTNSITDEPSAFYGVCLFISIFFF